MKVTVILKGANGYYHYELSDFDFTGDMVRLIESFVAEQLKRNFKRLFPRKPYPADLFGWWRSLDPESFDKMVEAVEAYWAGKRMDKASAGVIRLKFGYPTSDESKKIREIFNKARSIQEFVRNLEREFWQYGPVEVGFEYALDDAQRYLDVLVNIAKTMRG